QLHLIEGNDTFHHPEPVTRLAAALVGGEVVFRSTTFITTLWYATWSAGALALLGLFTRVTLLVFAIGNWVLVAHEYSYGERHHPEAIYCLFLMMLAFAPAGRCLSVDALLRRRHPGREGRMTPGVLLDGHA